MREHYNYYTTSAHQQRQQHRHLRQVVTMSPDSEAHQQHHQPHPQSYPPLIEPIENATARIDRSAILRCVVNLPPMPTPKVAWMKMDETNGLTLLTLGSHSLFTEDEGKYKVINGQYNEWSLQVNRVKVTDRGKYMCQVSAPPAKESKVISAFGYLDVHGKLD